MQQTQQANAAVEATGGLRLDPFALPVRYAVADQQADGRIRTLDLFRERVVIRRTVAGARMKYQVPTNAFSGVMLKLVAPTDTAPSYAMVLLAHEDPGLVVPLYVSLDADEALVECRIWARVLGLKVLLSDFDGAVTRLEDGFLRGNERRKRPDSFMLARRSRMARRRKAGVKGERPVARGEYEMFGGR